MFEEFQRCKGMCAAYSDHIQTICWEKFIFVCSCAVVNAVIRRSLEQIVAVPETKELLNNCMLEGIRVADACGIKISKEVLQKKVDGFAHMKDANASMARDIWDGKKSEFFELSGDLLRIAKLKQVEIPLHKTLFTCILQDELQNRGKLPLASAFKKTS